MTIGAIKHFSFVLLVLFFFHIPLVYFFWSWLPHRQMDMVSSAIRLKYRQYNCSPKEIQQIRPEEIKREVDETMRRLQTVVDPWLAMRDETREQKLTLQGMQRITETLSQIGKLLRK